MKNKKLKLNELKVKSFFPENKKQIVDTIKGGAPQSQITCPTPESRCFVCNDHILADRFLG